MSASQPNFPPAELEFLQLLRELLPILESAISSLNGIKPPNCGVNYLGRIATTVNRAADGYLYLRLSGRLDASKMLLRPALEVVFAGTAAVEDKNFLFRKAYSEWKDDNKLLVKNSLDKAESERLLNQMVEGFQKNCSEFPIQKREIKVQEIAKMAGMAAQYENLYRVYCKYTHSSMWAVEGNLNNVTDIKDTHTMAWCVLVTLNNLKKHTPALIPDLRPFGERLGMLKKSIPAGLTTSRIG